MSGARIRCSWIPVITRAEHVLLRLEPDWGAVWYWPSVTDDDGFRPFDAMLDAVSAATGVPRPAFGTTRTPIEVREFFEEIVHVPSGLPALYHLRVCDLSGVAHLIANEPFSDGEDREHRWFPLEAVLHLSPSHLRLQPEVPALYRQFRGLR